MSRRDPRAARDFTRCLEVARVWRSVRLVTLIDPTTNPDLSLLNLVFTWTGIRFIGLQHLRHDINAAMCCAEFKLLVLMLPQKQYLRQMDETAVLLHLAEQGAQPGGSGMYLKHAQAEVARELVQMSMISEVGPCSFVLSSAASDMLVSGLSHKRLCALPCAGR